jgi:hypothetical protein
MCQSRLLGEWANTIKIQLNVLVYSTKRKSSSQWNVTCSHHDIMQLSPLLECDPTVCLPEKSKVTRGWPNFSRGDKPSSHTPTRVIIGILYRIFLHQIPSIIEYLRLCENIIYTISSSPTATNLLNQGK